MQVSTKYWTASENNYVIIYNALDNNVPQAVIAYVDVNGHVSQGMMHPNTGRQTSTGTVMWNGKTGSDAVVTQDGNSGSIVDQIYSSLTLPNVGNYIPYYVYNQTIPVFTLNAMDNDLYIYVYTSVITQKPQLSFRYMTDEAISICQAQTIQIPNTNSMLKWNGMASDGSVVYVDNVQINAKYVMYLDPQIIPGMTCSNVSEGFSMSPKHHDDTLLLIGLGLGLIGLGVVIYSSKKKK